MATAIRNYKMAEAAGFDWVSISEHHYSPGLMTPNPAILAAAVSQQTSRVKIALLGPLIPLVNPVRTAEEIAMLDALSGGRVVVLFLRGTPNEHLTYGLVDSAETRETTQEGVQLVMKAWTEPKPFSWEGKHFQFKTVSVWPRTVQDPHPPIFYSGNSDRSAEFAGRMRLSVAIGFAPPAKRSSSRWTSIQGRRSPPRGWERGNATTKRALSRAHDHQRDRNTMRRRQAIANRLAGAPTPGDHADRRPRRWRWGRRPDRGPGWAAISGKRRLHRGKATQLHEAGVGILDVAFAGGGMTRSMELFSRAFGPALQEVA